VRTTIFSYRINLGFAALSFFREVCLNLIQKYVTLIEEAAESGER